MATTRIVMDPIEIIGKKPETPSSSWPWLVGAGVVLFLLWKK